MNFGKGFRLNESATNLQEEPSLMLDDVSSKRLGSGERMTPALDGTARRSRLRSQIAESFLADEAEIGNRRAQQELQLRKAPKRRKSANCIGLQRRLIKAVIVGLGILTALMIICELIFFVRLGLRMFDYQVQATRVSIQDPSISNYQSLVEVDRFFITDNQSPSYETVETGGRASYLIARLNQTCSVTDPSIVELWETQNQAQNALTLVRGSFPIFTISYTIAYMIAIWAFAFIIGPKIQYHQIPPFLRRKTRTKNLHAIVLIFFIGQIILAGCLMPLHFIDLSQSCIIATDPAHTTGKGALSQFFAMQVLLLCVTIPLLMIVVCRKISPTFTILFQVLLFVSMLFFLYLLFASYFYLWRVGLQDYNILQSILYLIVVIVPLLYFLAAILQIAIEAFKTCRKANRKS